MIVSNVIHCLLNSESSVTFVKLCNKDKLNQDITFATQNDGQEVFFELQDVIFEKLRQIGRNSPASKTNYGDIRQGYMCWSILHSYNDLFFLARSHSVRFE